MAGFFLTVMGKALTLFLMVAAGYAAGKKDLITDNGAKEMTSVLFYIVTPCLIVSSLQNTIGKVSAENIAAAGAMSIFAMAVCVAVGSLFFKKSLTERKKVFQFASIYSNCGFVGLPLAQAIMGDAGVAYASMFIVASNLFVWTHGLAQMSQTHGGAWKRLLLNPGTIGIAAGIPLFIFSVRIPEILSYPIQSLADLNTPLAMIVIGTYISRVPLKKMFSDRDLYMVSFVRLLLIPAICLALMLPLHADKAVLSTVLILAGAPSAANSVMFAAQFGGDTELASKAVAITTIISVFTMPLFPVIVNLCCS